MPCVSGCCAVYSTCHFRRGVYGLCVWLWCCLHMNGGGTVVIRWGRFMS